MDENDAGGIRCSEVLALLSDYLEGELADADRDRITAHVAECRKCARFGEGFASLVGSLGKLAGGGPVDPATSEAVKRALARGAR